VQLRQYLEAWAASIASICRFVLPFRAADAKNALRKKVEEGKIQMIM
jgi:hypothetical protein